MFWFEEAPPPTPAIPKKIPKKIRPARATSPRIPGWLGLEGTLKMPQFQLNSGLFEHQKKLRWIFNFFLDFSFPKPPTPGACAVRAGLEAPGFLFQRNSWNNPLCQLLRHRKVPFRLPGMHRGGWMLRPQLSSDTKSLFQWDFPQHKPCAGDNEHTPASRDVFLPRASPPPWLPGSIDPKFIPKQSDFLRFAVFFFFLIMSPTLAAPARPLLERSSAAPTSQQPHSTPRTLFPTSPSFPTSPTVWELGERPR